SQTRCDRAASLRELFGDLVPLAVVSSVSTDVDVCPGRDRVVQPGDAVTVLGTPQELRRQALAEPPRPDASRPDVSQTGASQTDPPPPRPESYRRARRRELVVLARSVWGEMNAAFRLTLLAIFTLVGVSTLVLRLGYAGPRHSHLNTLNAVYFTVETIATVGFGDFSYSTQSTWMRIFGIGVIILGAALVTTLFALVTNLLFSRNVAAVLGHQRIGRMQHHVVVVGLGAIGVRVVQGLLARGTAVVVIERDEHNRYLEQARELRVPILVGDATQRSTLSLANAERASAVAILTSNDLTNLEAGLTAQDHLRQAGSEAPVVLRVFDRDLSQSIDRSFGFRSVRSTAALAAPWFVGAALGLDIQSTFYVEHQLFLVARLTVATSGGLAGLAMGELSARIRVIAISRSPAHEQLEHPPRRNTRFAPGDRAYLVGPPEELLA
ncbi:MAG: potassium channel family protein, partial [Actinomycetes bacterium]